MTATDCPAGLERDLVDLETIMMDRLDRIDRHMAEADAERQTLRERLEERCRIVDQYLAELGGLSAYLAEMAARLRANS